jgi:hypothetical protein
MPALTPSCLLLFRTELDFMNYRSGFEQDDGQGTSLRESMCDSRQANDSAKYQPATNEHWPDFL